MGSLVGFFLFSFVADNYGRKIGLGTAWLMATLGSMLLGASFNIEMVGAGMFLCGFGVNPAITIHYSYINEHSCNYEYHISRGQIQRILECRGLGFLWCG